MLNLCGPPSTEHNISKLETVQRRAARYVMNDFSRYSSVSRMISQLGWPILKQRRDEAKVTMMYKILNNLVFMDHDLNFYTSQPWGHPFRLTTLSTRINAYHAHTFFPSPISYLMEQIASKGCYL